MCYRRYPSRLAELSSARVPSCVHEYPNGTHNLQLPAIQRRGPSRDGAAEDTDDAKCPWTAVSLPAMWPEQQPPGGEQNPQDPHPPQVPPHNPYQQPGYQQPNPYQQPGYQQTGYPQCPPLSPSPRNRVGRSGPAGAPQPPSGGGGNRTKIIAIVAAAAVVIAAGVTGFLVLGGDKDEQAGSDTKDKQPGSSAPAPSRNPRIPDSASASASSPAPPPTTTRAAPRPSSRPSPAGRWS